MKNSRILNKFLFRYEETINVKDSDFLKSNDFLKLIQNNKYFNKGNKSENDIVLEYSDDINAIKVFPNFIVKLHLKNNNEIDVKVSYSKYFSWIYIFGCLVFFVAFIADLFLDVEIAGGISNYPFILVAFPIFIYTFLLIFFNLLLYSCIKELKKLLI